MNQKEVSELRRRFHPDKSAISRIFGCFVTAGGEILLELDQSLALLTKEETEQYLSLLKKTLSGTLDKQLLPIAFSTRQVMEGPEHKLLSDLRSCKLEDADTRRALYQKIIEGVEMESAYLILLAFDRYDVPWMSADGTEAEDMSQTVFSYLTMALCPVKEGEPALGYFPKEQAFHCVAGQTVAAPELGFVFPAFDDRAANLYGALFYTRKADDSHESFVRSVFGAQPPVTAPQQKEGFHAALTDALEAECDLDVVQAVHEQLVTRIADHKESRDPQPPAVTADELAVMLQEYGVDKEKVTRFREKCTETFGQDAALNPKNLIGSSRFQIKTEQATLTLAAEDCYLVEERVIDGRRYLLIPAEDGMELNGLPIRIKRQPKEPGAGEH